MKALKKTLLFLIFSTASFAMERVMDVKWQRSIETENMSCVPVLIKADPEGVILINGSFDFTDKNAEGQVSLWHYSNVGDLLDDYILKKKVSNARRLLNFDSAGIAEANGRIIFESTSFSNNYCSRLFCLGKSTEESRYVITELSDSNASTSEPDSKLPQKSHPVKRLTSDGKNLYLLAVENGLGHVIKTIDNEGKLLSKQSILLDENAQITDVSISSEYGIAAVCGYQITPIESRLTLEGGLLAVYGMNGKLLNKISIDVRLWEPASRFPQVSVLGNQRIAVVYNSSNSPNNSDLYCDLYGLDLELIRRIEIYRSEEFFSDFGVKSHAAGFVVVNFVESRKPHIIVSQFDFDGNAIGSIVIDEVSWPGSQNILFDVYGNMVYLANTNDFMKNYTATHQPPIKTILTAIEMVKE